jgi:hypothetical protein
VNKEKQGSVEKDIQNFAKRLLKEADKESQLMYGKNIKFYDKPYMRQLITNQLRDKNISPDQLKITPKGFKEFIRAISLGMATAHYYHTTNGKISPQQFALDFLERLFCLSTGSPLLDPTFASYRRYFFRTIPSKFNKQQIDSINSFLKTIDKKEFYALGQQMTNLNLSIKKLYRQDKPITIKVIDNHKDIYDLCCSCVEKYLKILYGIKKAYDGTHLAYEKIKKISAYEIKKKLENNDRNYRLLLKPFSTLIWNADKHMGTLKNPANKSIEFIAIEGRKRKSYSSFLQLTKELCIVTFLLSRWIYAIYLKIMKDQPNNVVKS